MTEETPEQAAELDRIEECLGRDVSPWHHGAEFMPTSFEWYRGHVTLNGVPVDFKSVNVTIGKQVEIPVTNDVRSMDEPIDAVRQQMASDYCERIEARIIAGLTDDDLYILKHFRKHERGNPNCRHSESGDEWQPW